MAEKVKTIRGPIVKGQISKPWESNIIRPVYTVYLDSGMIVTNPDQFPHEEALEEEYEPTELGMGEKDELRSS